MFGVSCQAKGGPSSLGNRAHRGVVWCGVVWCGVVWCGVVWCGVVWCGVVWCGVVWCGVVWCGVVWCGVVWCGVVWCGVVWCGVVWWGGVGWGGVGCGGVGCGVVGWGGVGCGGVGWGVRRALLPNGNGWDVLHTEICKTGRLCVQTRAAHRACLDGALRAQECVAMYASLPNGDAVMSPIWQRPECLAPGIMQNRWALILGPTSNRKPYAPAAGAMAPL